MQLFRTIFRKQETWTELETLYTAEKTERICLLLADNDIPYKVRAALLPVPINAVSPLGTAAQSLWYLSVHPADMNRTQHLLRQERLR